MKKLLSLFLAAIMTFSLANDTAAATTDEKGDYKTSVKLQVKATGVYSNWDGVSNVAQFVDGDGNYSYAYESGDYIYIVNTKKGVPKKSKIKIKKAYPLFGNVTCDNDGNYYIATGRINEGSDTNYDTIFISKYDKNGKHIKTVGDNGSSSLESYYGSRFYTKQPFNGGNCSIAVNNGMVVINYARKMYSDHQSNSVFAVKTSDMTKVFLGENYNSHSFAQRAIPYGDGFAFLSEGDCYPRAFTTSITQNGKITNQLDTFNFWVEENTLTNGDMRTLNNNFAHTGGIAEVGGSIALVGTSAQSLNSKAEEENEQLFIQIFDPTKNADSDSTYVTTGKRSGKSGPNGDEAVTDYGVRWLTKFTSSFIERPQVVATDDDKIVILYESRDSKTYDYRGVYYMVLDKKGEVLKKSTLFSKKATLNPCQMPVYANGKVYWTANQKNDANFNLHIYSLIV